MLGFKHYHGVGVPVDHIKGVKWLRLAAEQGDARAQTYLGALWVSGRGVPKDYSQAEKWFRRAAEQGDAVAQFNLGNMYHRGDGVPQDYSEALKWFGKAAEQGDAKAQAFLGVMYGAGRGVAKDYRKAVKWSRQAAEQGNAKGQAYLGSMYSQGWGVPRDYVKAYAWLNLAAVQGNENAANIKDLLRQRMNVEQVAEAHKLDAELRENVRSQPLRPAEAQEYIDRIRKTAEQGDTEAQFHLGVMYANGGGVPQDFVKAYAWYILAAAQGNEEASELEDSLRENMTAEQVAEAEKLAAELRERIESSKSEQPTPHFR